MEIFMPVFKEIAAALGSILILIVGAFAVHGARLLVTKLGINVSVQQYNEIENIILNVIKSYYQKYTIAIKQSSSDNKLTDYQAEMIKKRVIETVKLMLSAEQVQVLIKKYNMETVDDILDTLTESILLDINQNITVDKLVKVEALTDTIEPINLDTPSTDTVAAIPTPKDLASISKCGGNCNGCPFNTECEYSRKVKDELDK